MLAAQTDRILVSVDYRLAPENKFPIPLEDCYDASTWVAAHADKISAVSENMAVCGDSAGGNLAAAVCLLAKNRGEPSIANQILIYPVTKLSDSSFADYPDELSPALTKADMSWFINHYVRGKNDLQNPYASPIMSSDLSGLPPALFVTAEYDILTKQCDEYARMLRDAGVRVNVANYPGLVHGFFTLPDVFDDAHSAANQINQELTRS
jgi:acetyl esterase